MGYDASGRVGSGCRPGMVRLRQWARANFGGGDLGCFNPASRAGGVPSLHADGRADDIAFNANDPAQRAAGDRFFHWIIANHEKVGLQETLWRGFLWSYQNRHLGIRGPGIQQGPHMNHVHWGVDYDAANNWIPARLGGGQPGPSPQPSEEDDLPYSPESLVQHVANGVERALQGKEAKGQIAKAVNDALVLALKGNRDVQEAIKKLVREAE